MPFLSNKFIKILDNTEQIIEPLFKVINPTYNGEYVNWTIGDTVEREFVKNKNTFYRNPGNAIIFGNGPSRSAELVKNIIQSNKNKILSFYNVLYACNRAHKDIDADFFVLTNKFVATTMPQQLQSKSYVTASTLRAYPEMNLIPLVPDLDSGSAAAYISCVHGASKVFLIGFDGYADNKYSSIYAGEQFYPDKDVTASDKVKNNNMFRVIAAYPEVEFYRVNTSPPTATKLLSLSNYHIIDTNTFISLADI